MATHTDWDNWINSGPHTDWSDHRDSWWWIFHNDYSVHSDIGGSWDDHNDWTDSPWNNWSNTPPWNNWSNTPWSNHSNIPHTDWSNHSNTSHTDVSHQDEPHVV